MPRDIPVGNGQFLVTFDNHYQIRDVYFPNVGQENHAGANPCRFGVYSDLPAHCHYPDGKPPETAPQGGRLFWMTEGWTKQLRYLRDTLVTSVSLSHNELKLSLYCNDCVDFHRPILIRRIKVKNLANHPRRVMVFHHQDFGMFGMKMGDTAYFDPELRGLVHYRTQRYLMATFFSEGEQGLEEFATGTSGFHGAEGTYRDAEDGHLQGNSIAQGSVDSTVDMKVLLGPLEEKTIYMVLIAGKSRQELLEHHEFLHRTTPQGVIDRTVAYWRLWVGGANINFGHLPANIASLFKRSLLIIRTQINNNGAIIAANDSDIMQFSRDTYSYMWPRDGALVAHALDLAGFPDVPRWFFTLCKDLMTDEGYLLHKYNPDGTPASSWHPWQYKGKPQLPIQEDETALVIWALWRHFFRYRDIEFVRPLYLNLITKAADFMVRYRHKPTGLPYASFDLWEERWGIHAFTVGAVYGGLKAAANFATCFGDKAKAREYATAAQEIQDGFCKHMWSEKHGRFLRRIIPKEDGTYNIDETLDASLYGIYKFHLLPAYDPRVIATMDAIEQKLWCKTSVGGVARYENDYYHRVSDDIANVPGNPWFICTTWLADYKISRASTLEELKQALPILQWCADHALESGVLAEQVNPYTNAPISVSPLTWSHAAFVNIVVKYLEKLETFHPCAECGQPTFHLRRHKSPVHIKTHAVIDEYDASPVDMPEVNADDTLVPVTRFTKETAGGPRTITLSIDTRECTGCGICVTNCPVNIFTQVDGKALLDLSKTNACTVCNQCEELCPTNVIQVLDMAADPAELVAGQ